MHASFRNRLFRGLAGVALLLAVPAAAGPSEDYAAVQRDFEGMLLRDNPEYATMLGVRDYDDRGIL